jgi:hypothetical protein
MRGVNWSEYDSQPRNIVPSVGHGSYRGPLSRDRIEPGAAAELTKMDRDRSGRGFNKFLKETGHEVNQGGGIKLNNRATPPSTHRSLTEYY